MKRARWSRTISGTGVTSADQFTDFSKSSRTRTSLVVAGLAIAYAEATGKSSSDVRFSGQSALGVLISHSADYSVGALSLLVACKGLAYRVSLSGFPAMFLGAAGGIAMSHLPGLPLVPALAMGIGAMCVVLLSLPLTSVLLATLLLLSDGRAVMPLVIVAVVVGYVVSARLAPAPSPTPGPAPTRQGSGNGGPGRGAGPGPLSARGRAQINRAPPSFTRFG